MNFNIYCDESGNSGGNYLDQQQPFYVLSGWLVPQNISYIPKNMVKRFKDLYYGEKEELKGSEILRSNIGQHNANTLFREIGEYCTPFYVIAEKRYCIAAKIVETYLDPIHNNKIPIEHTWKNAERKDIADLIYNTCERAIEEFGETYKNPEVNKFTQVLELLIEELNEKGFIELGKIFSGAYDYMDAIFEEEFSMIEYLPNNAMRTLNLPIFISFIQLIEEFSTKVDLKKVSMYHDNTKQFYKAYPEAFNWYAAKKKEDFKLVLQNGQVILSSLKKLKSMSFTDSLDSPLIQAADVFASFLNMYSTRVMMDKKISPESKKFGKLIIGGLLQSSNSDGLRLTDLVSSKYFATKLAFSQGLIDELPSKESLIEYPRFSLYTV
ncbi:DUF3800 domain-containing protein [Priestia flexa]|uniref:DUF3800 domain-containing protein n=1 Tax=Priestia flexa TaxID=86664 RepID=UPI001F4C5C04|nr:DUF3800 domain-containing protein [Priestia flexa]